MTYNPIHLIHTLPNGLISAESCRLKSHTLKIKKRETQLQKDWFHKTHLPPLDCTLFILLPRHLNFAYFKKKKIHFYQPVPFPQLDAIYSRVVRQVDKSSGARGPVAVFRFGFWQEQSVYGRSIVPRISPRFARNVYKLNYLRNM